jgi:hypothetical protein
MIKIYDNRLSNIKFKIRSENKERDLILNIINVHGCARMILDIYHKNIYLLKGIIIN